MSNVPLPFAALVLLVSLAAPAAGQDPSEEIRKGAQAYRLCAACHSLQPGVHLSGPSLAGRWGQIAGSVPDFHRYTSVLKESGIIWEESSLDGWLADSTAMVPGTTMQFRGIEDAATRKSLIAFLRRALAPGGAEDVVQSGFIAADMTTGQLPEDLSSAEQAQRIVEIRHCRDAYVIVTEDGMERPLWETNVRIKIDGSSRGPRSGPVLTRSGMVGDRASVVFPSLAELKKRLTERC